MEGDRLNLEFEISRLKVRRLAGGFADPDHFEITTDSTARARLGDQSRS